METKIKLLDKEFILKSKLNRSGVNFPNTDNNTLHNEFKIMVKRVLENNQEIKINFNFYDSQSNYEEGIKDLTEEGLKQAFRCFVEDAISGQDSFQEFCDEFGYSNDSRKAENIHKLCVKALDKFFELGFFISEFNDILEELAKIGIE